MVDSLVLEEQFGDDFAALMYETARAINIPGMDTREQRWASFRKLYKFYEREILQSSPYRYVTDRYELRWDEWATPIESSAWCDISYSLIVMYPQYPIGRYFADFAHPKLKVALELDGKAYHDPVKDRKRDLEMIEQGWTIYRVPGSECTRVVNIDEWEICGQQGYPEALADLETWALRTSTGVIAGITERHFNKPDWPHYAERTRQYRNDEVGYYYARKAELIEESAFRHCVNDQLGMRRG